MATRLARRDLLKRAAVLAGTAAAIQSLAAAKLNVAKVKSYFD